jgi:tRNA threonylcarbamoyladenosine biosynthesis protein TsaB
MRILCVDTSSKEIAIGLFDGAKTLSEEYINASRNYNSVLMPIIKATLDKAGLRPADIDIFASTLGPGSFTGIRVGMAAMKGFSQALDRGFAGATTLELLAAGLKPPVSCWAALDAGRGEVYAAYFKVNRAGSREMGPFKLETLEKFASRVKRGAIVATLSRETIGGRLRELKSSINIAEAEHISVRVFNGIILEKRKVPARKELYEAAPVYIRASEAEAALKRKKTEMRKKK